MNTKYDYIHFLSDFGFGLNLKRPLLYNLLGFLFDYVKFFIFPDESTPADFN